MIEGTHVRYCVIDTETTGIPKNYSAPAEDVDNWPRVIQLAWSIFNQQGRELQHYCFTIKPEGFEISEKAASIHGISTQLAIDTGCDLRFVLGALYGSVYNAVDVLVAHNLLNFDRKVLRAEFIRAKLPWPFEEVPGVCTMMSSTGYLKLPHANGKAGYKWPKLEELYENLFQEKFAGAHHAGNDVKACGRCFFELRERGVIK